jgi:hypothetical protein
VIDAEADQPVVLCELPLGRELDADEKSDILLDRAYERLHELEAVAALEPAVQMNEGDAGFPLRRPTRLDDVVDRFDGRFGAAHIRAGCAESAVQAGLPELADGIDVHAQVCPLQDPDARHRHVV